MSEPGDIDPQVLLRAGWSPEELYWEELSEAALALPHREALPYWREAAAIAPEALAVQDARQATSLANLALAEALDGRTEEAASLLAQAERRWEEAAAWLATLKPERRARSSLFHHRLQSKHPGGYDHWSRERYDALFAAGKEALGDRRQGRHRPTSPYATWQALRPAGFDDARRLIAAVHLIAPDP